MIRFIGTYRRCNFVHSRANCSISSPFSLKTVAIFLLSMYFAPTLSQQSFLSFIQPFLGGNGQQQQQQQHSSFIPQRSPQAAQPQQAQQSSAAETPMGQPNSFGGIDQFVELFQNMRQGGGRGDGNREERVQQVANMAQKILGTFTNSQVPVDPSAVQSSTGGGGGLNEYLNFGRAFGLGSALQENNNNNRRRRRQQLPPADLFTLFEDVGRKAAERRRLHSPPAARHQSPRPFQSNSPIVRLTDNFGRNFFQVDTHFKHLS